MPTIAELTIKVNTTDLDRANSSLDKLSKQSGKTKQAVNEVTDDFTKLRREIDPVAKSIDRLNSQQDRLKLAFAKGNVPTEEYARLNTIIEASRKRIDDLGSTTGKTAKEINFAMRGLPAQFTDIFVSLQGGQAPLTVFLQQGGQIKDMFGGIGPAFRAMTGYVLSLITPLTLAGAALGALAVGFIAGSKESSNFNKALAITGNFAGTSADELANMAQYLGQANTTVGKAAATLAQVASTGKIASDSFMSVASAAIAWEKATGTATEETIANFVKLREKPVEAVEELNEKMNFLSAEAYRQIRAFEAQGDAASAASLAEFEYAQALEQRTSKVESSLGFIEIAWNGVISKAKEGWDAILDVGRTTTAEDRLGTIQEQLEEAQGWNWMDIVPTNLGQKLAGKLTGQTDQLQEAFTNTLGEIYNEGIERQEQELEKASNRLAIADTKYTQDLLKTSMTNAQKRAEALKKFDETIARERARGIERSGEEIARARKYVEDQYKDPKTPRTRTETVREDAATRLLAQMKQQEASLTQQLDSSTKISSEETKLIKLKEQIAQIEQKNLNEKLTKEQASILANKEALLAQQQKNVEIQKEIQAQKELARLETIRTATANQLAVDQQKYQDQVVGAGRSDKEVERMKERLTLQREYNRQMEQLSRDRRNKEISEETYQSGAQEYKRSLDERTAALEASYAKMDQIQSDWSVGASKAWENYLEEGRNVAGMTQGFFTSAFSTIEDSLVSFVTAGKLSFKDLTVSILKDLAAMATRIAANQILMSIIGSFGGAAAGATSGAAATTNTGASFAGYAAKGKAFSGGVEFFANGGAFTNSIVNTPTAFATNSGMGVMGEAGPEAIMPLTRTSGGQLGVRMAGGATSTVVAPVSVTVNTDGGNGQGNGGGNNTETQGRAVQQAIKSEVEKSIQMGLQPGGRIWLAMNNR